MNIFKTRLETTKAYKWLSEFLHSEWYFIAVTAIAVLFYSIKQEVAGALVLASVICVILVLHEDILPTTFPFLLIAAIGLRMHDSFDVWIKILPALAVFIPVLLFHFLYYKGTYRMGKMFWPYAAVAFAITFGGLFSISPKDYFDVGVLYYTFGLGILMFGAYLLLNAHIRAREEYDVRDYISKTMIYFSAFLAFMVVLFYFEGSLAKLTIEEIRLAMQMRNNVSTNMLIAIPFVFYHAQKSKYSALWGAYGFGLCGVIFSTLSRGGILAGALVLVAGGVYCIVTFKGLNKKIIIGLCAAGALTAIAIFAAKFSAIKNLMRLDENESRSSMWRYGWDRFKRYPIFGVGLGHKSVGGYTPMKGGMFWYHSSFFQIIASLGAVGGLAYAFQLLGRLNVLNKKRDAFSFCLVIVLIGYHVMSLVNPGEFVPLPYAFIVMELFVIAEQVNFHEKLPIDETLSSNV